MVLCIFMEKRLQKILSEMGIASRRNAEELIREGKVTVNGKVAVIGIKADPERDYIKVGGKLIAGPGRSRAQKVYLMFHKPKGVVTTLRDPEGRPAVADFVKELRYSVFPVGRLDYDSEGLLLLTNDGDFANAVLHPSREIAKTYLVKVSGVPEEEKLAKLRRGVKLEDGPTLPARVKRIRRSENNSWIEMTIHEGRKRQIRRMLEKVGHVVLKLKRTAIDGLKLGDLKPGELRHMTPEELRMIKKELENRAERRLHGAR
ncbi:MAG: rRNA pseudouridine synthase [Nitrospirae bacterium]|nr:rRNA pseudouridine synthase [Nitrospirota bacterium]